MVVIFIIIILQNAFTYTVALKRISRIPLYVLTICVLIQHFLDKKVNRMTTLLLIIQ